VRFIWRNGPLLTLAHDASDGGLGVCLAEAAIVGGVGVEVHIEQDTVALFGEGGGQAVIACAPERGDELAAQSKNLGVPLRQIGIVGGDSLFGVPLGDLEEAWKT
jgi:phosphoribosylformylglycinamidine synthase subunit PurL